MCQRLPALCVDKSMLMDLKCGVLLHFTWQNCNEKNVQIMDKLFSYPSILVIKKFDNFDFIDSYLMLRVIYSFFQFFVRSALNESLIYKYNNDMVEKGGTVSSRSVSICRFYVLLRHVQQMKKRSIKKDKASEWCLFHKISGEDLIKRF